MISKSTSTGSSLYLVRHEKCLVAELPPLLAYRQRRDRKQGGFMLTSAALFFFTVLLISGHMFFAPADVPLGTRPVPETVNTFRVIVPYGCDIKGVINQDGTKIYHLPGEADYDQITVNPQIGEMLFCTESGAVKSGFHKAYQ